MSQTQETRGYICLTWNEHPSVQAILKELASEDDRSLSAYIRLIMRDHVNKKGRMTAAIKKDIGIL